MMRLIDKLVLKDLVGPFINGMLMFLILVFTASFLFPATDMIVKGVPIPLVMKFILYALPSLVTQTFPMAMLLAALMGFGRLSSDREAVAIFAAGISFPRMARVVYIMGALVSVAAFIWNETVVPPATTAMYALKQQALNHLANSDQPLFYNVDRADHKGIEEMVKVDGGYDARTRTLRKVTIIKYSANPRYEGMPEVIVYCNHATTSKSETRLDQRGLNWTYYDGFIVTLLPDEKTGKIEDSLPLYFKTVQSLPRGTSPKKTFEQVMSAEVTDNNRKSFSQLRTEINADLAAGNDTDARGKEVDLYGKIALPLASMIFGIVGAALGLNTQRGGSKTVGFGVAIFIVFLYWVFYHSMFVVGKNGGLPPMLASFLADIVGATVGVILAIRASR
jgi:lipopolysaccharide export system permease protein